MNVAIIGASARTDAYSYRALESLAKHGHRVFPVNPSVQKINGMETFPSPADIHEKIHTITMYVNEEKSTKLIRQILDLHPIRIIFNPGSENQLLEKMAKAEGVMVERACTLVLLATDQFGR
jgi:predicted CoA-binding protein